MQTTEQGFKSIGTELGNSNTAEKFRAYRLAAESTERKLKEAEIIIHQLKDETNFSRNAEKFLRNQLSSAQGRLVCQEKLLKQFLTVSVQQRQNKEICQHIEKKVEKIMEELKQTREECQSVFKYASGEQKLLIKIKDLESALNAKGCDNDLLKMEIQTVTKEKENTETEFQKKISHLETELQKSIKKEEESLTLYRETLLYYKKQIEDYEQKIERYENDRKSFLEDFAAPNEEGSKSISETFTQADSTVNINMQERSPNCGKHRLTQTDKSRSQTFQCLSLNSGKYKPAGFRKGKEQSFQRVCTKPKPQLDFLTGSQDSSLPVKSVAYGQKRRLFSTNCNHYID